MKKQWFLHVFFQEDRELLPRKQKISTVFGGPVHSGEGQGRRSQQQSVLTKIDRFELSCGAGHFGWTRFYTGKKKKKKTYWVLESWMNYVYYTRPDFSLLSCCDWWDWYWFAILDCPKVYAWLMYTDVLFHGHWPAVLFCEMFQTMHLCRWARRNA